MRRTIASRDWATAVDAIVRRTPESASERDPLRAQVRLSLCSAPPRPSMCCSTGSRRMLRLGRRPLLHGIARRLNGPTAAARRGSEPARCVHHAMIPWPMASGRVVGTAAASREMVVVETSSGPAFGASDAPIALVARLRACWSGRSLTMRAPFSARLALYYRERRAPSTQEARSHQCLFPRCIRHTATSRPRMGAHPAPRRRPAMNGYTKRPRLPVWNTTSPVTP